MSRIGKLPITLPQGITVDLSDGHIKISGSLGDLTLPIPGGIKVEKKEQQIFITRTSEEKKVRSLHGLIRSLIYNMVVGVSQGFTKELELVGVGYKAELRSNSLVMSIGYSHPVTVEAPDSITFEIEKNVIRVKGIDKQLVGQVSANIRKYRKPEPYKGTGIKYLGERILRKAGKSAK